jgi:hypothetical protein
MEAKVLVERLAQERAEGRHLVHEPFGLARYAEYAAAEKGHVLLVLASLS